MAKYVGKPCKRGHDGTRYRSSKNCVVCALELLRNYERSSAGKENHLKRVLKYQRKYPEIANARNRAFHARNPHKATERANKRRALLFGSEGNYTATDVQIILEVQRGLCFYCEVLLSKWHEDHFVPLSKGGSNYRCNIVLACAKCNLSKGDKAPVEFLNWQMKLPAFWKEGETKMGQRQYESATVFNARIADLRHLWVPSDTYKGQKTTKPNYFAMFLVKKTQATWHTEPALAGITAACGKIYAVNPHIVTWPVVDGDTPSPEGKSSEFAKGHWLFSASTGSPPNVEIVQAGGTLAKLTGKIGVKSGDYVMVGVTAAVKQNDARGVKLYLNAVVFSAPGEEIVFANSVSGAELMQQAQKQGLQVAGFTPQGGFTHGGGGFAPAPASTGFAPPPSTAGGFAPQPGFGATPSPSSPQFEAAPANPFAPR